MREEKTTVFVNLQNIPDYENVKLEQGEQKFMLQDIDKRNFILQNKKKKTKIIPKSEKNVDLR